MTIQTKLKTAIRFTSQIALIVVCISYFIIGCAPTSERQDQPGSIDFKSGFVDVNGIRLYYKEAGTGDPILFLHGGLGTSDAHFQHQFAAFAKKHKIITLDTRGHGRSEFDEKKFTFELFADDTYDFLEALEIDSVNIVGFSDGGITGTIMAIQHPKKVKNLVIIGTNTVPDTTAIFAADIEWVKNMDVKQMADQVKSSFPEHPSPERLTDFVEKMQSLWLEEPNLTDSDLRKISCPVLIIAGDDDTIKIEHQVYLQRTIPDSDLLIVPNTGHDAHIVRHEIVNKSISELLSR